MSARQRIISLSVAIALLATFLPLGVASAASVPPEYTIKSNTANKCLDVYQGTARAGTTVGLYRCDASDNAERFAFGLNAKGYVEIFFKPTLCVGASKVGSSYKATLQSCSATSTYEHQISKPSQQAVFSFSAGSLTAPVSSAAFSQAVFTSGTSSADQIWQFRLI